jgi:hypothetical protein
MRGTLESDKFSLPGSTSWIPGITALIRMLAHPDRHSGGLVPVNWEPTAGYIGTCRGC